MVVDLLTEWLKTRVQEAGAQGVVFGLSGGIDSAVVGALSRRAFGDDVLGIIMPCQSSVQDMLDAKLVADELSIPCIMVELDDAYQLLLGQYEAFVKIGNEEKARQVKGNIKPRLRMITLYYFAQALGYLVVGTSNRDELEVGYFTKYGDGGVDLMPIGALVKSQVRELAKFLGVPECIINKVPSAGLYENQTDEAEMGIRYEDLDRYLLTGEGTDEIVRKIRTMQKLSEHKRRLPPIPEL
ncbi:MULTISPECIES: NAD(+) synthase [Syntrophothermus]|uniref:NH(3)-dependent NAD(+) synthetase n=1 Tax=Syntrophothermus lipocalidus (strain DSM 12680 / TGB-C1) TaxID=643648 RepID=D7CLD3_SYNLT|nr:MULTISPECIES: NAD(+) synthase [Syntrophothermus]ADI01518.1 NAD+ synthetase [Syntrophothermus lipocalidus DSM 12680]NSW83785.1 NAD(+) synthase [Syntrophothermus sp.]